MFLISVIVCCHNSSALIANALEHIFDQQGVSNDAVQIIVVDNCSSDDTSIVARSTAFANSRHIEVVAAPIAGLMHARRVGVAEAKGGIVCFVDDDNWLDPNYLRTMLDIFTSRLELGYLGGMSRLPDGFVIPPEFRTEWLSAFAVGKQYPASCDLPVFSAFLWGAGFCIRLELLKEILAAQKQFKLAGRSGKVQLAGDDSELCYRASKLGAIGRYDERLTFVHAIKPHRFTLKHLEATFEGFGRSRPILNSFEIDLRKRAGKLQARNILMATMPQLLVLYTFKYFYYSANIFSSRADRKIKTSYFSGAIKQTFHECLSGRFF